jgi:hypothetical protein
MYKILKYPLVDGITAIPNVCIVKFLTIQQQNNVPTLWILVDEETKCKIDYIIYKIGTGWSVTYEETKNYIATSQDKGYVWHWFWQIRNQKED